MDITALIERLGTAVAVAVVLGFCLKWAIAEMGRRDKKHAEEMQAEREYSRSRDESYVEAMRETTQVLALLSERVK